MIASLFTLFTVMLPLAGCTAMISAPVTMPIWIVLGCIFVIRPVIRLAWWLFTILSLSQTFLIALFGFFAWYDLWQHGSSAIQVRDIFFLFLFPAISTIAIIFAMILARATLDTTFRRILILLITILAAAFTIGPVVYVAMHY
jgi:hypothetical protein